MTDRHSKSLGIQVPKNWEEKSTYTPQTSDHRRPDVNSNYTPATGQGGKDNPPKPND